jgi:O-antigen ligase
LRPFNIERILRTVPFILVIISIPFPPIWGSVAIAIFGLSSLYFLIKEKKIYRVSGFFYLLSAAYLVRIIWMMGSSDISYALKTIETEAPLIIFPILLSLNRLSLRLRVLGIKVYIIVACSVMFFSFLRLSIYVLNSPYKDDFFGYLWIHLNNGYVFWRNIMDWEFAHPSFLGAFMVYGMLMVIKLGTSVKHKIVIFVYIVGLIIFSLLTGSRSNLVLLALSFGVLFVLNRCTKIKQMILLGSVIFLALIIGINNYDEIDSRRFQFAKIAISSIVDRPLLGYGTGSQKAIMNDTVHARDIGFVNTAALGLEVNHPHNQYLTELVQFGLIGSIPFFLFLFATIFNAYKDQNILFITLMIIIMAFMMVEAPINSNKGLIPLLLAIILLSDQESSAKLIK